MKKSEELLAAYRAQVEKEEAYESSFGSDGEDGDVIRITIRVQPTLTLSRPHRMVEECAVYDFAAVRIRGQWHITDESAKRTWDELMTWISELPGETTITRMEGREK